MGLKSWWQFCQERFPLAAHGPMIALYVYSFALYSELLKGIAPSWPRVLLLFIFTTLFFFQLRLFDEIKDYQHDLTHNPTRPLPRGLLSLRAVHVALVILIGLQFVYSFSFSFGHGPFSIVDFWPATISYSLLMFREFYLGKFLRPHLTTYALTHTLVTVLLGLGMLGQLDADFVFGTSKLAFVFAPWFIFNLFEFARKTYSAEEDASAEKMSVPTYSKIFSPLGAVLLSFSQVAAASFLLTMSLPEGPNLVPNLLFFCATGLLAGLLFVVFKSTAWAKIFRLVSSIQIIWFFLIIIAQLKGIA